jgi:hypothetical protein
MMRNMSTCINRPHRFGHPLVQVRGKHKNAKNASVRANSGGENRIRTITDLTIDAYHSCVESVICEVIFRNQLIFFPCS